MTIVNRLIAEAKHGAAQLTINARQVRPLAEHMHACFSAYESAGLTDRTPTVDHIADEIRAGRAKVLDVPVNVVGVSAVTS